MATVTPFRGIRYNPEKVADRAQVTTPPYDVISPEEQAAFHDRHPNNVIRLILGQKQSADSDQDNPHTRAAGYYRQWVAEGVLQQDLQPALYLKAIGYTHAGTAIVRYGLIALVGLEPFEKRIILPHEKTFSKVRSERLQLMKATHCNFCPIFALYPDDGGILNALAQAVDMDAPIDDFVDDAGHRHRLWSITDPAVHRYVTEAMREKRLFIADGHHRYETALAYREGQRRKHPGATGREGYNFTMMYLAAMEDPGVFILPTHRVVNHLEGFDPRAWFAFFACFLVSTLMFWDLRYLLVFFLATLFFIFTSGVTWRESRRAWLFIGGFILVFTTLTFLTGKGTGGKPRGSVTG